MKKITQSRHCDLCKYEKRSLKNGLTCGITNKRPDFKMTCSSFKLAAIAKQNYKAILNEFENSKDRKKATHFKFYWLILIGFSLILYGNFFLKDTSDFNNYSYNISLYSFKFVYVIYSFGITFILVGYSILNKYRRKFKKIKYKKNKIDEILELYEIKIEE